MRHGQREAHGDRGVDGVAARLQHRDADIGGVRLARHHHGVPRAHRLRARTTPRRCRNQRDQQRNFSHKF